MDSNKKIVALVLGMHRSGTSALTGLLDKFGAVVPLAKDTIVSTDNPKGHWEHRGINKINDQILRHFGQTWTTWQPLDLAQIPRHLTNALEDLISALIAETEERPVVFKDPRICILLPVWLQVLEKLDVEIKLFLCVRHPDAVAVSLQKRNQLCIERGLLLWLHYNLQSFRNIGNKPILKLMFPDWLEEPKALYQSSSEIFALNWPESWDDCGQRAMSFVDRDLVHHQNSVEPNHPLMAQCLALFNLIGEMSDSGPYRDELDDIETFYAQISPWMEISANVMMNERDLWRKKINDMYSLINRNI